MRSLKPGDHDAEAVEVFGVAIVNGRMRSLKLAGGAPEGPGGVVAIVNGRMRSLKLDVLDMSPPFSPGCDSEWPYEVTETTR